MTESPPSESSDAFDSPDDARDGDAAELEQLSGLRVYPRSITAAQHSVLFLGQRGVDKFLGAVGMVAAIIDGETTSVTIDGTAAKLTIAPSHRYFIISGRKRS